MIHVDLWASAENRHRISCPVRRHRHEEDNILGGVQGADAVEIPFVRHDDQGLRPERGNQVHDTQLLAEKRGGGDGRHQREAGEHLQPDRRDRSGQGAAAGRHRTSDGQRVPHCAAEEGPYGTGGGNPKCLSSVTPSGSSSIRE